MGQCVQKEWAVGGGGLNGALGNRGCVQECFEGFHRGCVDYLSRQFVLKWDSPNAESELATAGT